MKNNESIESGTAVCFINVEDISIGYRIFGRGYPLT